MKILLIGLGGFFGAVSRYYVTQGSAILFGSKIPYGTLLVNVFGSFVMGLLFVYSMEKIVISENLRFFLGVGFLGAFTTFSTFSLESYYLLNKGTFGLAAIYIIGNLLLSIAGAYAGIFLARL